MVDKTNNPKFYAQTLVPFSEPSLAQILKITFFDFDSVGKNDVVGTVIIHKKDFDKFSTFRYVNLYGAYPDYGIMDTQIDEMAKLMNEHPELANMWKGRAAIMIRTKPCDDPKLFTNPIP